ncbi:IS891/IS1136/IS1341 transposase [Microseira wollei NIES-4236]|uniref:IS891/IS1136/IS1341 transposase n=1 Tax=Microseira wollei NIES-4236 TaxID=2530354 RepID=A0AAV3X1Q7_9CYAN|nr:IS891/IS1136/IS1341 transposase [Microseira wollei NIES-4236]
MLFAVGVVPRQMMLLEFKAKGKTTQYRADFPFVNALNSHACQVAIEWAYASIARFYDNCRKSIPGKKSYPKFKKNCRSVDYKTSGWKLSENRKQIAFTDKKGGHLARPFTQPMLDNQYNLALNPCLPSHKMF